MGSARATRNTEATVQKAAGPHSEGRPSVFGLFDETQDPKSSDETKVVIYVSRSQEVTEFVRSNKGLRSSHISEKTMPRLSTPLSRSVGGRNTEATSLAALSAPPRQCPPHPPRFNSFGASGLPSTPGSRD
ncbi:unnamed protein product [Musa acuminata subsp. malaccensis]|uniref:(wild Malaysian banana) hypothetical protein n=1 Tax=Musa acuminata subsp. malaccensis TaxID=214687 RepID=A0A804LA64_MUSAM|nr:unnamed protein product [Musa acuminata subsp. malaccensis]